MENADARRKVEMELSPNANDCRLLVTSAKSVYGEGYQHNYKDVKFRDAMNLVMQGDSTT